tara:strand:- start:2388 stop:2741 length:354 start_codon:yes stop_codon:yes gene_type:complete
MKIFIYGSLMQGEHNHTFLNDEHSKYLRKDITSKEFTLYNLGYFPGMVQDGTGSVLGEIYEISSFVRGRLDQLEGHPQFYRRTLIELQSGEKIETYLLDKAYVRGCPVIKSGDWRDL